MNIRELIPTDSRKSFYGKAKVAVMDDKTEILFSYDTAVLMKRDGQLFRLWDDFSATTGRHIASYCGLNKKGYMSLPYSGEDYAFTVERVH